MPRVASQATVAVAQEMAATIKGTVEALIFTNVVISMLIAGPLNQLLDSIKQLQLVVHLMLINLAYPVSSTVVFSVLMQILSFQFYDFTDFYTKTLNLDSDGNDPLND